MTNGIRICAAGTHLRQSCDAGEDVTDAQHHIHRVEDVVSLRKIETENLMKGVTLVTFSICWKCTESATRTDQTFHVMHVTHQYVEGYDCYSHRHESGGDKWRHPVGPEVAERRVGWETGGKGFWKERRLGSLQTFVPLQETCFLHQLWINFASTEAWFDEYEIKHWPRESLVVLVEESLISMFSAATMTASNARIPAVQPVIL